MTWIFALLADAVTMGVLDVLQLGPVARSSSRSENGDITRASPNWVAAAACSVTDVVGVVVMAVRPCDGVGTDDLTSQATTQGFTWRLTAVDMAWDTGLTAAAAAPAEWVSIW